MRADVLVVAASKQQDLGAALLLALAEERHLPIAQLELLGLLLQALVDAAEGGLVLSGLFYRARHRLRVSSGMTGETTVSAHAEGKASLDGCRSGAASEERGDLPRGERANRGALEAQRHRRGGFALARLRLRVQR